MGQSSNSTVVQDRKRLEEHLRIICAEIPIAELGAHAVEEEVVIFDFVYRGIRCVLMRARSDDNQHLSPREQEIVRLVAAGHPNKVIAGVLEISYWTVSTHLRRIFAKLGVTSRAAMVARVSNTVTKGDVYSD